MIAAKSGAVSDSKGHGYDFLSVVNEAEAIPRSFWGLLFMKQGGDQGYVNM